MHMLRAQASMICFQSISLKLIHPLHFLLGYFSFFMISLKNKKDSSLVNAM